MNQPKSVKKVFASNHIVHQKIFVPFLFFEMWYGTLLDKCKSRLLRWHSDMVQNLPHIVKYLLVVVGLLVTGTAVVATASATSVSITGQITNQSGKSLAEIDISVYKFSNELVYGTFWPYHDSTISTADGRYSFLNLAAGTYRVGISMPLEGAPYYSEFYGGTPDLESATDIIIVDNQTASDINIELDELSKIRGTVTDADGNVLDHSIIEPWHIDVQLYKDTFDPSYGAKWSTFESVSLNTDGTYLFDRLPEGTYRLSIENLASPQYYISEFHNDAANLEEATDIVLGRSDTTTVDFSLNKYGSITGNVIDRDGNPIEAISIQADKLSTDSASSEWQRVAYAETDQAGNYSIFSLVTGSYRLTFSDNSGYHLAYYNNAASIEDATEIRVTEGEVVSNINVQIDEVGTNGTGKIRGTITDYAGNPISGAQATLLSYDQGEEHLGRAYLRYRGEGAITDANGEYVLDGVPQGEVTVRFSNYWSTDQNQIKYMPEFYDDVPDALQATMFTVAADETITGINAQLEKASRISGQITDINDTPLSNIDVSVSKKENTIPNVTEECFTDCEDNPCSGDFNECENPNCLEGECEFIECEILHPDEEPPDCDEVDCDETTLCTPLEEGEFGLEPYPGDNSINSDDFNWQFLGSSQTDESGHYTISGLLPGTYRVHVYDNVGDYVDAYFTTASEQSDYTEIEVSASNHVRDIDVKLQKQGVIKGRVTDMQGIPIANLYVSLYQPDGSSPNTTTTNADGYYTLKRVPSGDNIVLFGQKDAIVYNPHNNELDTPVEYQYEFYGDTSDHRLATKISLASGMTIENINAQLVKFGAISGKITDEAGYPLEEMKIDLLGLGLDACCSGWNTIGGVRSDAEGNYRLPSLQSGIYKIYVSDQGLEPRYGDNYYGDVKSVENAIEISVNGNEHVTDINITVSARGNIAGTVFNLAGNPLSNILVTPYTFDKQLESWTEGRDTYTDSNGKYLTGPLPSGNVRLRYGQKYLNNQIHIPKFFNNAGEVESATDILVTDATTVSDINIQLAEGAIISGKVTTIDRIPLVSINVGLYSFNQEECCSGWQQVVFLQTDFEGRYSFRGLPSGTYRVGVNRDGDRQLQQKFFNNASQVENATDILLSDSEIRNDINFGLTNAAQINGTVTDMNDAPIVNLEVAIYIYGTDGWGSYTSTRTDRDGNYTLTGVSPREYKVAFTQHGDAFEYVREFYDNNATDANTARSVFVCDNSTVILENFQFGKPVENTPDPEIVELGDYNLHMPVVITNVCS